MPGIEDSLIQYAGSFSSTASRYRIATTCKSIISMRVYFVPTVKSIVVNMELPTTVTTGTNGYKYVEFVAKSAGVVYYDIIGSEKSTLTNSELSNQGSQTFSWAPYHAHNGSDSPSISASNIFAGTTNAGKVCIVNQSGYLSFIDSSITLPTAITGLKIEGIAVLGSDATRYIQIGASVAGDIDIIWTTDGDEGAGETGSTYHVYIEEWVEAGSGPLAGNWEALLDADSDSAGAAASKLRWDLNDAGELELLKLYRFYVVATKTATSGRTVSVSGYFKLEEPSL